MEKMHYTNPNNHHFSESLATHFKEIANHEIPNEETPFVELEQKLENAGFSLADQQTVFELLHDNQLLCRSENFSRVLDLILTHIPIEIQNKNYANMCTMSESAGYRVAMAEGFSGKDVGSAVKTVLTFSGNSIENHGHLPTTDDLWKLKPNTAEVSIIGSGTINHDDVKMVSFRFPIALYPEDKLTEQERELLDDEAIHFIVRHYTPSKTAH